MLLRGENDVIIFVIRTNSFHTEGTHERVNEKDLGLQSEMPIRDELKAKSYAVIIAPKGTSGNSSWSPLAWSRTITDGLPSVGEQLVDWLLIC